MHTAPGACLLYASGAVCFSNMVLEHIIQDNHMVLDHMSRPKSLKSLQEKPLKCKVVGVKKSPTCPKQDKQNVFIFPPSSFIPLYHSMGYSI